MIRNKYTTFVVSAVMLMLFFVGSNTVMGQPFKQGPPVPSNFCVHSQEMELYLMINEYRKDYGLPPIVFSKSLSYVAATHLKDLFFNHPDQGTCNFHSWSNKGSWSPFCYPKDENKKNSVWEKPRELTRYPSRAYEIVYWENNPLVTDTIFMVWKTENYFNSFLLNTGKWLGKPWNAIGIAVYENYACAWFGETRDPEGEVYVCGKIPKTIVNNDFPPSEKDSLSAQPSTQPTIETQGTVHPKDSTSVTYYIIVKTSIPLNAANKLVADLKAGDYPNAKVLEKDNKIRVSVFESTDKSAVMAKLKEVKKKYADAWLLKR